MFETSVIAIKSGGEMASGVAAVLYQAGFRRLLLLETPAPMAVRRTVSFCEAVYDGVQTVEDIGARLVSGVSEIEDVWGRGEIAIAVDPEWKLIAEVAPTVVIDATLAKRNLGTHMAEAPLVIALGPGFTAGKDAHLVIETQRGHDLGRILQQGAAEPNTGTPGNIGGFTKERVLRAPCSGTVKAFKKIGDSVQAGEAICAVGGEAVHSAIAGVLRGLIRPEISAGRGTKLGDVDPRGRQDYCLTISEKARAIGGATLGAICGFLSGRR